MPPPLVDPPVVMLALPRWSRRKLKKDNYARSEDFLRFKGNKKTNDKKRGRGNHRASEIRKSRYYKHSTCSSTIENRLSSIQQPRSSDELKIKNNKISREIALRKLRTFYGAEIENDNNYATIRVFFLMFQRDAE